MTRGILAEIRLFRNEILKWGVIMAALAEAVSMPLIGPDIRFSAGLIMGTAAADLGFILLTITGERLIDSARRSPVFLGYLGRMLLYGAVFALCLNRTFACGMGCLAGFVTIPAGIMFLYGIYYRFLRRKENPLNCWNGTVKWRDLSEYDEDRDW